jgi:hypothetical protein
MNNFLERKYKRQFVCYFFHNGFDNINFGISINLKLPNIEIHIPFGFIRIGFVLSNGIKAINQEEVDKKCFGLIERFY